MNFFLWGITAAALLVSVCKDRGKTTKALKMALKRIGKMSPLFLAAMALYALLVAFIQPGIIRETLGGESSFTGMALAVLVGSVALMPGFVAFPLCALLATQGVPYGVLAAFSVSLMNVGVATFPLEVKYLGLRVTLLRNAIGLVLSVLVGLIVALAFGEVAI